MVQKYSPTTPLKKLPLEAVKVSVTSTPPYMDNKNSSTILSNIGMQHLQATSQSKHITLNRACPVSSEETPHSKSDSDTIPFSRPNNIQSPLVSGTRIIKNEHKGLQSQDRREALQASKEWIERIEGLAYCPDGYSPRSLKQDYKRIKDAKHQLENGTIPIAFERILPTETITAPVITITHAMYLYDEKGVAEKPINGILQKSNQNDTVIQLISGHGIINDSYWYARDRAPDFIIPSHSGEHDLRFSSSEVTITGGYIGKCLYQTIRDLLYGAEFNNRTKHLEISVPMNAVFFEHPCETFHSRYTNKTDSEIIKSWISDGLLLKKVTTNQNLEDNTKLIDMDNFTFSIRTGQSCQTIGKGPRLVIFKLM